LLITLVIINACSINKRVYRAGYNIEWNTARKTPAQREFITKNPARNPETEILNPLYGNVSASAGGEISPIKTPIFLLTQNEPLKGKHIAVRIQDPCDTIVFKNGLKIKAKILEISASEIKYKMCDNQDGPLFIKNVADIAMVNHSNGSVTEMSSLAPTNNNNNSAVYNNSGSGSGTSIGQTKPQPTSSYGSGNSNSGKSQIIALVLCGFLGIIGVHRFYMGHIGIGLLMFFTLGCCGVLWIIDFVRILSGDLTPKDGDFSEKI
jgi:hypothetical protein